MAIGISRAIHLVTDGEEWDPESTASSIVDAIRADEAESGPFDVLLLGNETGDTRRLPGRGPGRSRARPPGRDRHQGHDGRGRPVRCEQEAAGGRDVYEVPLPAVVAVLEGINLPALPVVPGRIRAKNKPVAASSPARPGQRLEMLRLVVPEGAAKQATILGTGASAASAVVDLLDSVGVL